MAKQKRTIQLNKKKDLYLKIKHKWFLPKVDVNPVKVTLANNCKKSEILNMMTHTTKTEFGCTSQGSTQLLLRIRMGSKDYTNNKKIMKVVENKLAAWVSTIFNKELYSDT